MKWLLVVLLLLSMPARAGDWTTEEGQISLTEGENVATSLPGLCTGNGVTVLNFTTPSWPVSGITVHISHVGTIASDASIDLTLGTVVVVDNLFIQYPASGTGSEVIPVYIPIHLRSSTGYTLRCSGTIGGSVARMAVTFHGRGFRPSRRYSVVRTYGVDDTGQGTSIDPGPVANTKGAWTQITASTSRLCREFFLMIGFENNTSPTGGFWLVDVGAGAPGSEVVLVDNIPLGVGGFNGSYGPFYSGPYTINLPVLSRIAIRAQSNITDATDRLFDVGVYCLS